MTQRLSMESSLYLESIVHSDRHKCVGCGEDGSRSCLVPDVQGGFDSILSKRKISSNF
jgi:hypothetical protein